MSGDAIKAHTMIIDTPHNFPIFNDQPIGDDPFTAEDLEAVSVAPGFCASATWSSDCEWYFVIGDDSILLANISGRGVRCRVRTSKFFEWFLAAGFPRRRTSLATFRKAMS
jgi:hypothetical protein